MHPNYGNNYEYYDQRKNMVNPIYPSPPMNDSYYQRPAPVPTNISYNEQPYYEMKYNPQPSHPVYPSYNSNPNTGNVNPPQMSSMPPNNNYSSYGNIQSQPPAREDVSFFLESFENYFQQQGLFNNPNNQRNSNLNQNQPNDFSTYPNSNNSGMNNVNYPPNNFVPNPAHKLPPNNNPYYKYPSSYPQQQQQQYPQITIQEKPIHTMPSYQNNPNPASDPRAYQQQPHPTPNKEYRRPNEPRKFERNRTSRPEFREKFKKKHFKVNNRRRSSSKSSDSRSSRSHSRSTHVRRKPSENIKKSVAFKKMLKDKNNWECPNCKNLNFSKRIRCNRCHKNKPSGSNKEFVDTRKFVKNLGGPPGLFREGDWACSKCDNINFAKRQCCNRCGKEKDSTDTVGVIRGLSRKKGEKSEKNESEKNHKSSEAEGGGSKENVKNNNNTQSIAGEKKNE